MRGFGELSTVSQGFGRIALVTAFWKFITRARNDAGHGSLPGFVMIITVLTLLETHFAALTLTHVHISFFFGL